MTWEIALGVVSLVGFCIAIGQPVVRLTQAITKLNSNCEFLASEFVEFGQSNRKHHQRLWEHNQKQDKLLAEHKERLHDLDGK